MKKHLLALIAVGLFVGPASAATLTFELDTEFSNATPPAGTAPWVTATFDDSVGTGNQVQLTISASGLVGTEFISEFAFNFNPGLDPTGLSFSFTSDPTGGNTSISTGTNSFKADGDGFFDVALDMPPPPGAQASKFTANETMVILIEYTAAITVEDFNVGSIGGSAGKTGFGAAAHIQGIGPEGNDSGWIADGDDTPSVPEPATVLLLGMGLMALGGFAARRRKVS